MGRKNSESVYPLPKNHILLSKLLAFKHVCQPGQWFSGVSDDNPQMINSLYSLMFHRVENAAVLSSCVVLSIQEKD